MLEAKFKLKWGGFRQNFLNWRNKNRDAQFTRVMRARERSISILQKRYGYTKAQAATELKRHYSKGRPG